MFHKLNVLVGSALVALVVSTAWVPAVAQTQESEQLARTESELTTDTLARAILERIPDVPHTAPALGRGAAREGRAQAHAAGIMAAVSEYRSRWEGFAVRGHWSHFNVDQDLPVLISALVYRESAFQPVVRLDGGARVFELPIIREFVNGHYRQRVPTADMGVMQVRASSAPAHACGVLTRADGARLIHDIAFGYRVGTCVLTNRIDRYVDEYAVPAAARLHRGMRPDIDLRFFGVSGTRRDSSEALRARELLVIERYNWGGGSFYMHPVASDYARRLLQEFERFHALLDVARRAPSDEPPVPMGG